MNHQEVHHHDIVGETTLALSTSAVVVFAGTGPIANLAAHVESQTQGQDIAPIVTASWPTGRTPPVSQHDASTDRCLTTEPPENSGRS